MSPLDQTVTIGNPPRRSRPGHGADVSKELKSLRLKDRDRSGRPRRLLRGVLLLALLGAVGAFAAFGDRQRAEELIVEFADSTAATEATEWVNALWGKIAGAAEVSITAVRAQSRDRYVLSTTGFVDVPERINISPKVPGTIIELPIETGMLLEKGDLCLRLEDTRYQTELAAARAALEVAESRLEDLRAGATDSEIEQARSKLEGSRSERELAEKALDRANRLLGTIAKSRHEQAVAALQQAKSAERTAELALEKLQQGARPEQIKAAAAEVERAAAAVELAEYSCQHTRIHAPQGGTVLELNVELGQIVSSETPGLGPSLCVLADLSQLMAIVDVSERDLSQISAGHACEITTDAYPDRVYQGRLHHRSPIVNRQRGAVEVEVEILDPDEKLLPDMNCSVVFLRPDADQEAVLIPERCLQGSGQQTYVFVHGADQRARKRHVQVRESTDEGTLEVIEGLRDGELVLVTDGIDLEEGQRVEAAFR